MTAAGTLEVLGPEAKPLAADADLFGKLVEAGRKKAQDAAAKVESSEFNVLGTLAQERKQYETASEFFELALKADPAKAAEVLLDWGIGSLIDDRPAEAVKVFQRGLDMKALPEGNPVFHYYLAGALAACDRFEPALAAARLAAEKEKRLGPLCQPLALGPLSRQALRRGPAGLREVLRAVRRREGLARNPGGPPRGPALDVGPLRDPGPTGRGRRVAAAGPGRVSRRRRGQ